MTEIFERLESNDKKLIEETKQKLCDQFTYVKDPWLLNGLYDYYLNTNSARAVEVLVSIIEPHHLYLFEKLSDSILKSSKTETKVQALTLLGYVARKKPSWLSSLTDQKLFKELLKLLKCEAEILPLLSALLVLIILIPMVPLSISEYLNDIFEIFSRLASWNCNPGRLVEDQIIHMQVALYALFLRLYGMFPCNFLNYLRTEYSDRNGPIFVHTIKPMLETVIMNPSIITTTMDKEKFNERWKSKDVSDVIVECERYSVDISDTCCAHDTCQLASGFRSRSGTANSTSMAPYFQSLKNLVASMTNTERGEHFTPSMVFVPQTPPVGAAATYALQTEFTHDENIVPQAGSSPPEAAIEATPETTPVLHDSNEIPVQNPNLMKSIVQATATPPPSPLRKEKSPFTFTFESSKLATQSLTPHTSPMKVKPHPQTSPLKIKTPQKKLHQQSPIQSSGSSGGPDDEMPGRMEKRNITSDILYESEDSSSPCSSGGLHMVRSDGMRRFMEGIKRLRHHSYNPETERDRRREESTGSSPGNYDSFAESALVRRAKSCPEMKKETPSIRENVGGVLEEEDLDEAQTERALSNGMGSEKNYTSTETQTEHFWPYEHLFLCIFPGLENAETKSSPGVSEILRNDRCRQPSIYEILDSYIQNAVEKDHVKNTKTQLQLVHQQLLFERHRREIHAYKNRCFLADAKSKQQLEEHNSALRDQVQLQQKEIDNLRYQLEKNQNGQKNESDRAIENITIMKKKCKLLEEENRQLKETNEGLAKDLNGCQNKCSTLTVQKQQVESMLVDALVEVKMAKEKVLAGERDHSELEYVNQQLLMIGELQLRYNQRLNDISSLRRTDEELELLKKTYSAEVRSLNQCLNEKLIKLEASSNRINELEQIIHQNEEIITGQKKVLNSINEENEEKLKAVENKCQTLLMISRALEEKLLEFSVRKVVRSPDTSSCQEVQIPSERVSSCQEVQVTGDRAGGTAALSELSSPLSCSLASSEGSSAQAHTERATNQTVSDSESGLEMRLRMSDAPTTSGTSYK